MNMMSRRGPVQPGEPAPDFNLPAVYQDGQLALGDYRGRPLFLAIFLGLWCPFCRRNIANLSMTRDELLSCGVETLAVVATELDNARLYFKYRPARVPIAADPALTTHRAYGLPQPQIDDNTMQLLASTRINPTGELAEPVPATQIGPLLDHADNFKRLRQNLPVVDQSVSALLDDLSDHGLLQDTLVMMFGEFGRTPAINKQSGRDHWAQCYSLLLAGGPHPGGARDAVGLIN